MWCAEKEEGKVAMEEDWEEWTIRKSLSKEMGLVNWAWKIELGSDNSENGERNIPHRKNSICKVQETREKASLKNLI